MHQGKDLSIDFITGLPISTTFKDNSYNLILVIVDNFTKIIYFELVKVTIYALGLAKVVSNLVI